MISRRARALRYETAHPYQFVQTAVWREIVRLDSPFVPEPNVTGHPSLKAVATVTMGRAVEDDEPTPLADAALPPSLVIPRELVEGAPSEAIGRFFGHLGELWQDFLNPDGYRPLKGKNALAIATIQALIHSAGAFGLPSNHPAYGAMIAAKEGLLADRGGRQWVTLAIRSSTVSLVEQGHGRVSGKNGKPLTKDDLRYIVLEALQHHCGELLPKGGARSIDSLRGWESGKDTSPVERMSLKLPLVMDEQAFTVQANQMLGQLALIYTPIVRALVGGG